MRSTREKCNHKKTLRKFGMEVEKAGKSTHKHKITLS